MNYGLLEKKLKITNLFRNTNPIFRRKQMSVEKELKSIKRIFVWVIIIGGIAAGLFVVDQGMKANSEYESGQREISARGVEINRHLQLYGHLNYLED